MQAVKFTSRAAGGVCTTSNLFAYIFVHEGVNITTIKSFIIIITHINILNYNIIMIIYAHMSGKSRSVTKTGSFIYARHNNNCRVNITPPPRS